MSTAPLPRDQQIELMVNAAERHAAHAARWMADAQVAAVMRARDVAEPGNAYQQETKTLSICA